MAPWFQRLWKEALWHTCAVNKSLFKASSMALVIKHVMTETNLVPLVAPKRWL